MVFGEIIEPSTRALIDDDVDYTQFKELQWQEEYKVPDRINSLLVVETPFAINVLNASILDGFQPICKTTKSEVLIYKVHEDDYIVICNISDIAIGEVTEKLIPWLLVSVNIYTITTASSASYQNKDLIEKPGCFIRMLTTTELNIFPKLETPNLVTGIGANVLSFSVHTKRDCSLFIAFIDSMPMDSVNSAPFVHLLQKLNYKLKNACKLQEILPSNNLYM